MSFCRNCGRELGPDDKFCPACGKEIHGATSGNQKKMILAGGSLAILVAAVWIGFLVGNKKGNHSAQKTSVNTEVTEKKTTQKSTSGEPNASETSQEGDTGALSLTSDVSQAVREAIDTTKKKTGYYEVSYSENQGILYDFDGDGTEELLLVYRIKDTSGSILLRYALWSLTEGHPFVIEENDFYEEAGGNTGTIGAVKYEGNLYLMIHTEGYEAGISGAYGLYPVKDSSFVMSNYLYFSYYEPEEGALKTENQYITNAKGDGTLTKVEMEDEVAKIQKLVMIDPLKKAAEQENVSNLEDLQ